MIRLVLIVALLEAFSFGVAGQIGSTGTGGDDGSVIVGTGQSVAPGAHLPDAAQLQDQERRIFALESGKQDLSAWASIFITSITLLALANVSLSVWQVGSIARNEVGK